MIKTKKAWSTSTQVNILWGWQWKTKSERNILQSILALPLALQKYNLVHKYTCILKVLVTSLSQQLKWLLLYFGLSFLFTFLCMASTKNDIIAVSCIASIITRIKKIKTALCRHTFDWLQTPPELDQKHTCGLPQHQQRAKTLLQGYF